MKKVDDIILERLLEQCKYIKWINVSSFDEYDKLINNKINREEK